MKAVLISIQPKWCELIANNRKTLEIRKGYPRHLLEEYYEKESDFFRNRPSFRIKPFKCYIYETKKKKTWVFETEYLDKGVHITTEKSKSCKSGKVIGEFICDNITRIDCSSDSYKYYSVDSCLTLQKFINYSNGKTLYGWHITDLKIYDKPKELRAFYKAEICKHYDGGCDCWSELCQIAQSNDCHCGYVRITRPPQSWCYVEELEVAECVKT